MIFINDPADVEPSIDVLRKSRKNLLGVDTETTGLDPLVKKVLLLQVGDASEQYVYDVARCGRSIQHVVDYLDNPDIKKVFHNAKFDYSFMKSNFNSNLKNTVCTYLSEQLLTRGKNVKLGLDTVVKKYLNVKLNKEAQSTFQHMKFGDEFSEEQLEYAGEDVAYLPHLFLEMSKLLRERGMNMVSTVEYETVRAVGDMELNGIYLNGEYWLTLKDSAVERLNSAIEKLDPHFKPYLGMDLFSNASVNYNSHQQVKPILEKLIGEPLPNTEEPTLVKYESKHEVIGHLLDYREAAKKISTYGESFIKNHIHKKTGRVHTTFRQIGAETGRFASKDPNAQNIPKEQAYRTAFQAETSDYKIISADFKSQELALIAKITEDPVFVQGCNDGKDLHSMAASVLFGIPYEDFFDSDGEVLPDMKKKYRTPAKSLNFGLAYGMGPTSLGEQLQIPFQEARDLMDKYFSAFPRIKQSLNEFENNVLETHIAYSPLDGRRIDLSAIDWDNPAHVAHAKNQAKNFPFQGSGATVTKVALCYTKKKIDETGMDVKPLITVHDEIVFEAHKDIAQEASKMISEEMVKAFHFIAPDIRMEVDAIVADHWVK